MSSNLSDQTQDNKQAVARFIDGLNAHNMDVIDQVFSPDFQDQTPGLESPTQVPGAAGIKRYFENYLRSFPDLQLTLRDLIAEADKVMAHVDVSGTQEGEFLGIPATHRHGTTQWVMIFRLENGLIVETWDIEDELTLLRQLGVTLKPPA